MIVSSDAAINLNPNAMRRIFNSFLLLVFVNMSEAQPNKSPVNEENRESHSSCERFFSNGKIGITYVSGENLKLTKIQYRIHEGRAIVEGDIDLGTVEEMEKARLAVEEKKGDVSIKGVVISGSVYRWPDKKVVYSIDENLPDKDRVTNAIKHWEENTEMRFVKRTNQTKYVTFKAGPGCSSPVGMPRGQGFIILANECSLGNVIHEIGHAVGLWHEQSREDRDEHVEIKWDNVEADKKDQFDQHISDGEDAGDYDFGSIMHYPKNAFAIDKTKPTIVTKPPGEPIGQRAKLSPGDIAAVKSIYP